MKKLIPIVSLFALLISNSSKASHTGMMELTYRHITGNTYEFTLVFYRNCVGATAGAPTMINLGARSGSLAINSNNVASLIQLPISGPNVPPLKPNNLMNCTVAPVCFEEYVYRGTLNLNNLATLPYAKDWEFFYSLCCFPGGAMTPRNINGSAIYTVCGLNNLDFPNGNDAPFWHDRRPIRPGYTNVEVINYPGEAVCENRLITHKQNVVEYEGDNIRYEFIEPYTTGGLPIGYINGFNLAMPMNFVTPPGLEIDSISGHFDLIAQNYSSQTNTIYVLGILAKEYRNDTIIVSGSPVAVEKQIGFVYRNYMLMVEGNCPDTVLAIKTKNLNLTCVNDTFDIETTYNFQCATADKDGSFLRIQNNLRGPLIVPDSVTIPNCEPNDVTKKFTVHLANPLPAGDYSLTIDVGNDGNTLLAECEYELPANRDSVSITMDSTELAFIEGSLDTLGTPLTYLEAECGQKHFSFRLTEKVKCSSVEVMGSDFIVVDSNGAVPIPINVDSALPALCINGLARIINITLKKPLEGGRYALFTRTGTDGNTLLNQCDRPSTSHFIPIVSNEVEVDLGPDLTYCKDSAFYADLDPGPGYSAYSWSTGDIVQSIAIVTEGEYVLTVFNQFGCLARDTVVVTEIDCSTGIDQKNINGLSIYPNPSNNKVTIALEDGSKIKEVVVTNINGQLVYQSSTNNSSILTLETLEWENGIYFIRLLNENGISTTSKFTVSH